MLIKKRTCDPYVYIYKKAHVTFVLPEKCLIYKLLN